MTKNGSTISDLKTAIESIERRDTAQSQTPPSKGTSSDAFSRIVRLCSVRDRSVFELKDRLAQEGFDEVESQAAVDRAVACGLVDDVRFADSFIRGRLARGKGMQGIERELKARGIDASALPGWPDEYCSSDDSERDRALAVLKAAPPRAKNVRDSAFRKLINKGFSSDVAASAAREWSDHARHL